MRHIDNSILKYTLQFYILRTWINRRAKSFSKTSVNVTETRIDDDAWKKISCANNPSVHLEEHYTKAEGTFHLFYAPLFLSNLSFKFNIVLIRIFFDNFHRNLYITDVEVYPVPLRFFMRASKILMRSALYFSRFSASKCSYNILIFS